MRGKVFYFTIALGILLFQLCQPAKAESTDHFIVRDWDEYQTLSASDRAHYLTGLRLLILELSALEANEGLDYSATSAPQRTIASVEDRSCIYAGWLKLISINGRYCERPPNKGCASGSVQCNPLLFGHRVCTQTGAKATAGCMRNAKPAELVARELTAKDREEWNSFKADLDSYCTRGRQASICHLIQSRLAQMERVVTEKPRVKQASSPTAKATSPVSVAVSANNFMRPRIEVTPAQAPVQLKAVDLASTDSSLALKPAKCDSIGLLEEIKTSSGAGVPLLTPLGAQALLCERGAIDTSLITARRSYLTTQIARVSGSTSDARYYRNWLNTLRDNLDACVAEAERLRASHAIVKPKLVPVVLEGGGMVTLVNGFSVNGRVIIRPNTSTHINYLGRMVGLTSFGICDIEFRSSSGGSLSPEGARANQ